MAVTQTPRLGLTNWSAGTDKPTRAQANADHGALEQKTAIRMEQPFAARPAPGVGGVLFLATDTHVAYWDNGVGWEVIGRVTEGTRTIKLTAGQNANLDEYRDASGTLLSYTDKAGVFNGGMVDPRYPWVTLALTAVFTVGAGMVPVKVRRSGEVCQITGQFTNGAALNGQVVTTVPALYVPRYTQSSPVWGLYSGLTTSEWAATVTLMGTDTTVGSIGIAGGPGTLGIWPAVAARTPPVGGTTWNLSFTYLLN